MSSAFQVSSSSDSSDDQDEKVSTQPETVQDEPQTKSAQPNQMVDQTVRGKSPSLFVSRRSMPRREMRDKRSISPASDRQAAATSYPPRTTLRNGTDSPKAASAVVTCAEVDNPSLASQAREAAPAEMRPADVAPTAAVPERVTRSAKDAVQSLKRRLFPRLVALRLAFPEWDDHQQSGRWHTDFILARAMPEDLEDYRAILAVMPCHPSGSSPSNSGGEFAFSSPHDKRVGICVIQGLDAFRASTDPDFSPLPHTALMNSSYVAPSPPPVVTHTTSEPQQLIAICPSATRAQSSTRQVKPVPLMQMHQVINEGGGIVDPHPSSHRGLPSIVGDRRPTGSRCMDNHPLLSPDHRESPLVAYGSDSDRDDIDQYSSHAAAAAAVPVDSYFLLRRKFRVFRSGGNFWSCNLVREDRQFFLMQLLENVFGEGYVFYWRWGHDDKELLGQDTNYRNVASLKEGCQLFEETFEFKTGNLWYGSVSRTLSRFIPVKGKYILHDDVSDHVSLALPLRGIIRGQRREMPEKRRL